jgi:tetratricopeptide (TPR) repeat protein
MTKKKFKKIINSHSRATIETISSSIQLIEILLLLASIITFIYFLNNVSHIQDDAFITFRYVKNLVEGNGLVFNAGERVEGYTNFLWTIILTVPTILKIDIVNASQFLSSFFGIAVLIVTFFISRLTNPNAQNKKDKKEFAVLFNLVPVVLLVFTGAFSYWASSGMETSFFIFLILIGLFFYIKKLQSNKINYYTPIFLSLATLTRPEGILFFAIVYLHKIIFIIRGWKKSDSILRKIFSKENLFEISIFLTPVLFHTIFRLIYYSYPLPNTYYAKVNYDYSTFKSGIEYLILFIQDYLLYGTILAAPLFFIIKKKFAFEISLFYLIIFLYSFYVIIIGGDVLALHRFWLIITPLVYILWGIFLKELNVLISEKNILSNSKLIATILLLVTIVIGYYNYISNEEKINQIKDKEIALVNQFQEQAEIINNLESIKKKKLTIAISTIGALSYYTDATVIDMLGLTDEYIAHNPELIPEISNDPENPWKEKKYNTSYIISRKPDYILFSTGSKPSAYAERALFTNNNFFYNYFIQFIPRPLGRHLFYYARKSEEQIKLSNPEIMSVKINPNWIKEYVNFMQSYNIYQKSKSQKQFELVKKQFDETIKSGPVFFAETYRIIGDVYFLEGDINKAIENYNKALSLDSLNVLSYLGLGGIYQNLKNEEKANFYAKEMKIKGLVQEEFVNR